MSLEDDREDDVTFSLSGPLQFRSWYTNESSDSDAEMLNLLDNEEQPARQDPATPSTSQTGGATSHTRSSTSQHDAMTLDIYDATSPAATANGNRERTLLASSWRQSNKSPLDRQQSITGLESDQDDTLKCVFSSFLFFVIIAALFLFIFLKNPAG